MEKPMKRIVLFVCEHGSAKSTVAAAHFNKIASECGLRDRAISRGTNPDEDVAPKAAQGLEADGLATTIAKPKKLSEDDLAEAVRVITFCDLPKGFDQAVFVERWDDIPAVSEDYERSRDAMVARIRQLLEELSRLSN